MIETLTHASAFAKLTLLIALAPLAAGLAYAIQPSEARLALMRPLSLAGLFAALASLVLGVANVMHGLAAVDPFARSSWQTVAMGLAEALRPAFVTFGFLAVAWMAVALGVRRQP